MTGPQTTHPNESWRTEAIQDAQEIGLLGLRICFAGVLFFIVAVVAVAVHAFCHYLHDQGFDKEVCDELESLAWMFFAADKILIVTFFAREIAIFALRCYQHVAEAWSHLKERAAVPK